jgi:hypothetical protein
MLQRYSLGERLRFEAAAIITLYLRTPTSFSLEYPCTIHAKKKGFMDY